MRRYAVAGDPVRHSLSPWIHAHFARVLQKPVVYAAYAPADFSAFAGEFFRQGGRGLNVTVPFKKSALDFAGNASAFARRAGAANVLAWQESAGAGDGHVAAYNTDGAGLTKDIARIIADSVKGARTLIAGAGGAARAAALSLSERGAKVTIAARNPDAAESLAHLAGGHAVAFSDCDAEFDIILNAISGGHAGQAPPLPLRAFEGAALAYDLNYGKAAAPFLRAATAARLRADGGGMLVEQAALSFAIWESALPPTASLIQDLDVRHRPLWEKI